MITSLLKKSPNIKLHKTESVEAIQEKPSKFQSQPIKNMEDPIGSQVYLITKMHSIHQNIHSINFLQYNNKNPK